MKSINRVTLIGAVGQDPETRFTAAGMAIASFSLATSTKQKDKDEITQWHNCVAFGKLAEIVQQYVTKGSKLYLDGAIQYQCVDKDGEKRYYTKIIVNDMSMLSSPKDKEPQKKEAPKQSEAFEDSDIPF
jgi:single-strand DNA-binding protein